MNQNIAMNRSVFASVTGIIVTLCILAGPLTGSLYAQSSDTDPGSQLREQLKNEYFSLSSFIQFRGVGEFGEPDGVNETGFFLPHARLKINGKLSSDFSYNVHVDVADASILMDAVVGYHYNSAFNIAAGAQKPGISAEFLQSPGAQEFSSRSQVVSALSQNRELGVRFYGSSENGLNYSVGIFNGNRLNINDNNSFYYAGRLGYAAEVGEDGMLEVGGNMGYSDDRGTTIGNGRTGFISGDRLVYGADFRYVNSGFLLYSEILAAELDSDLNNYSEPLNVFGYHISAGYFLTDDSQVVARWDSYDTDLLTESSDLILLGWNVFPTDHTKFQINYRIPAGDAGFENHGVVANFNIGF